MDRPRFTVQVMFCGAWVDAFDADSKADLPVCIAHCGGLKTRTIDRGEQQLGLFGGSK